MNFYSKVFAVCAVLLGLVTVLSSYTSGNSERVEECTVIQSFTQHVSPSDPEFPIYLPYSTSGFTDFSLVPGRIVQGKYFVSLSESYLIRSPKDPELLKEYENYPKHELTVEMKSDKLLDLEYCNLHTRLLKYSGMTSRDYYDVMNSEALDTPIFAKWLISRVSFANDRNYAFIYAQQLCGPHCVSSGVYIFKNISGRWEFVSVANHGNS